MSGIDARTRLMLALDVPTTDAAHELLNRVGDHIHIIKDWVGTIYGRRSTDCATGVGYRETGVSRSEVFRHR